MVRHPAGHIILALWALLLVSCVRGTTVVVTPTLPPSPTLVLTPTNTPTVEVGLTPPPVVIPPDALRLNIACNCEETATTQDFVAATWIWVAESADLVQAFLDTTRFTVTVDGVPLANSAESMGPVEPYDKGDYDKDGRADFYARWLYGLGELEPGIHTIRLAINFSEQITDGFDLEPQDGEDDLYGPGIREFFVRITVR